MSGIDLDKPINYKHSSLRFFKEGERHVSRICNDDVLLLVFDGILNFQEDGKSYSIKAGEYHIQKHNSKQTGEKPSEKPSYFYAHFIAEWDNSNYTLLSDGKFDYSKCKSLIDELDFLSHSSAPYIIQTAKFYELLSILFKPIAVNTLAQEIADYITKKSTENFSIQDLCDEFHFSKNHIINKFKKEFGVTPITYLNKVKIKKAEYLMEVTSDSLDKIALECGYNNYSNFYNQFCKHNNISPEHWRETKRHI